MTWAGVPEASSASATLCAEVVLPLADGPVSMTILARESLIFRAAYSTRWR